MGIAIRFTITIIIFIFM